MENQYDNFELISILLVSHGSSGSHLLFKYPFSEQTQFKIINTSNNLGIKSQTDNYVAALCVSNNEKLELKIDNVFLLGSQSILRINQVTYNVVFALKSPLPRPVIRCYQSLSLAISKALLKEETNSEYLTAQSKKLNDLIDEQQNIDDNNRRIDTSFTIALEKSSLAQEFKNIYESIRKDGIVNMLINNCVTLSFCMPHLAYKIVDKCEQTSFVDVIFDAYKYLKPYVGILILMNRDDLIKLLPINCNYHTKLLIEKYNPTFSLARYAAELDIPVNEVYAIVDHLIHWAKVKIIYPITETNVYVINPNAYLGSQIATEFSKSFENASFYYVLSEFSFAKPLTAHLDPRLTKEKHTILINMVIWLLQRNILMQIHNYLFLIPKKFQHQRLSCEQNSKISDVSIDEDSEFQLTSNRIAGGAGSEHSNDTENTDQNNNLQALYDEYRKILDVLKISEKEQQYVFKAFERNDQDLKLFIQLTPYLNGLSNLEAIIYYEQLNRSELITFLDKYQDLIMVSSYEDPNPLVRINVRI